MLSPYVEKQKVLIQSAGHHLASPPATFLPLPPPSRGPDHFTLPLDVSSTEAHLHMEFLKTVLKLRNFNVSLWNIFLVWETCLSSKV